MSRRRVNPDHRLAPRKKPRQSRSQATVQAIEEAAAYILEHEGWERFTTNRIAERAGVNISSLYQYFPNKMAILDTLRRAHVLQCRSAMIEAPVRMYVTSNPDGTATLSYKMPSHVFAPYFEEGGDQLRAIAAELDAIFAAIAARAVAE